MHHPSLRTKGVNDVKRGNEPQVSPAVLALLGMLAEEKDGEHPWFQRIPLIDIGTCLVSINHDGKKEVLVHIEILNAIMSLPCPTFGHNFSNVLVGCWCKRFKTIVLIFIYAQVVEVIEYRAAEKVTETVDEREVDTVQTLWHFSGGSTINE